MRKIIPLLIAILLLSPVLAAADAADQAENNPGAEIAESRLPDFVQDWKKIKGNFSSAEAVANARATYEATFAEGAERDPAAKVAIEAGLAAAENATSDLALVKAQQQVDKSLYAVALANTDHFLLEGNLTAAKAWFTLLDAKFGDAVAPAAEALANADENNTAEVAATVRANVQDVALYKVFKEVTETPMVLADGNVAEAVKEAAEGRYYYLSTRAAVLETLGAEAEAALVDELDHLLEEAEANEVTESEEIAENILTLLGKHAALAAPSTKADAWLELKALVKSRSAENLTAAEALYEREFADAAERLAPVSAEKMNQTFPKALADLETGDEIGFALAKQTLDKALYDVAFQATLEALDAGNPDEALVWYKLLATKLKFLQAPEDNAHLIALGKAAAANGNAEAAKPQVIEGTVNMLLSKVEGELDATFRTWDEDAVSSHEKAIEAILYYEPARATVRGVLGEDSEHELHHEIEEFFQARVDHNLTEAEQAAGEIRTLIGQYRAESMKNADLAEIVPRLIPTLNLIVEEYVEYFDYLEQGDTAQAEAEIVEAHTFTGNVRRTIEKRIADFEAADAAATAQVLANLDTVGTQLDDRVEFEVLEATVAETKTLLLRMAGLEAEAEDDAEETEAGTVTLKFGTPTPEGDAYVVPVYAIGLPAGGSAWQLLVTFDAEELTVEKGEAFGDVKAAKVEDGTFVFNGAITGDAEPEHKLAELLVVPAEGVTETELGVEVQALSDVKNRELALEGVEGQTLTFADESETTDGEEDAHVSDGEPAREAPGLGLAAAVITLGTLGLALRRREA